MVVLKMGEDQRNILECVKEDGTAFVESIRGARSVQEAAAKLTKLPEDDIEFYKSSSWAFLRESIENRFGKLIQSTIAKADDNDGGHSETRMGVAAEMAAEILTSFQFKRMHESLLLSIISEATALRKEECYAKDKKSRSSSGEGGKPRDAALTDDFLYYEGEDDEEIHQILELLEGDSEEKGKAMELVMAMDLGDALDGKWWKTFMIALSASLKSIEVSCTPQLCEPCSNAVKRLMEYCMKHSAAIQLSELLICLASVVQYFIDICAPLHDILWLGAILVQGAGMVRDQWFIHSMEAVTTELVSAFFALLSSETGMQILCRHYHCCDWDLGRWFHNWVSNLHGRQYVVSALITRPEIMRLAYNWNAEGHLDNDYAGIAALLISLSCLVVEKSLIIDDFEDIYEKCEIEDEKHICASIWMVCTAMKKIATNEKVGALMHVEDMILIYLHYLGKELNNLQSSDGFQSSTYLSMLRKRLLDADESKNTAWRDGALYVVAEVASDKLASWIIPPHSFFHSEESKVDGYTRLLTKVLSAAQEGSRLNRDVFLQLIKRSASQPKLLTTSWVPAIRQILELGMETEGDGLTYLMTFTPLLQSPILMAAIMNDKLSSHLACIIRKESLEEVADITEKEWISFSNIVAAVTTHPAVLAELSKKDYFCVVVESLCSLCPDYVLAVESSHVSDIEFPNLRLLHLVQRLLAIPGAISGLHDGFTRFTNELNMIWRRSVKGKWVALQIIRGIAGSRQNIEALFPLAPWLIKLLNDVVHVQSQIDCTTLVATSLYNVIKNFPAIDERQSKHWLTPSTDQDMLTGHLTKCILESIDPVSTGILWSLGLSPSFISFLWCRDGYTFSDSQIFFLQSRLIEERGIDHCVYLPVALCESLASFARSMAAGLALPAPLLGTFDWALHPIGPGLGPLSERCIALENNWRSSILPILESQSCPQITL